MTLSFWPTVAVDIIWFATVPILTITTDACNFICQGQLCGFFKYLGWIFEVWWHQQKTCFRCPSARLVSIHVLICLLKKEITVVGKHMQMCFWTSLSSCFWSELFATSSQRINVALRSFVMQLQKLLLIWGGFCFGLGGLGESLIWLICVPSISGSFGGEQRGLSPTLSKDFFWQCKLYALQFSIASMHFFLLCPCIENPIYSKHSWNFHVKL